MLSLSLFMVVVCNDNITYNFKDVTNYQISIASGGRTPGKISTIDKMIAFYYHLIMLPYHHEKHYGVQIRVYGIVNTK